MFFRKSLLISLFVMSAVFCFASVDDCYAKLDSDSEILSIGNDKIERNFFWNKGQLITKSIIDKQSGKVWLNQNETGDLLIPGITGEAENAKWSSSVIETTSTTPSHIEVVVEYNIEELQIRRVFTIYPDSPTITTDTYLKTNSDSLTWDSKADAVLDQLFLSGKHWKIEAVEFFDTTDRHNTLVEKVERLSYRSDSRFRGNLLNAFDVIDKNGLFFLKEAPSSINQVYYPGYDYVTNYGKIKNVGLGVQSSDLLKNKGEWVKTYGSVLGVYDSSPSSSLFALRDYQKQKRVQLEDRDEMIVMNTWGDREDLERLTEDFCLEQMKACSELGITHFQIDWGWQEGTKGDNTRRSIDVWSPKKELYPNGFNRLIEEGKKLGVELCLYYVPKAANNNAAWEEDADALINLYKNHGVRIFKIDGQKMQNRIAEINTQKMYDKVMKETGNNVVFNLDITNSPRGGYFYMNETGNLFVQNRYTDWSNYYPYQTLRNLWMLSAYVPAERMQFEFLNKWRNQDNYSHEDKFSPMNYSLDYLFAVTMPSQPLAFFDAAALPDNPLENENLIKIYQEIQHDLHKGYIFPIGEEPSGESWTGFQSLHPGRGYFIIYREDNGSKDFQFKTFLDEDVTVEIKSLTDSQYSSVQTTGTSGEISFSLPEKNNFDIFEYNLK